MAEPEELSDEPEFIFRGTVRQVGAATLSTIIPDSRVAVVHVAQVLLGAAPLLDWIGREVTVQFSTPGQVEEGREYEFQTRPWLFGESLAVISQGQRLISQVESRSSPDPIRARAERELRKHVAQADLIVSGQVTAVRLPTGAAGVSPKRQTRKDPRWREAVIEVTHTYKGASERELMVLFPSSRDVVWKGGPQLEPGREGIFLVHRVTPEEVEGSIAQFVCLHDWDVQPLTQSTQIEAYLSRSTPQSGS